MTIKIGVVSDLHAEFWNEQHFQSIGSLVQQQLADADLILLPGDINSGRSSISTAKRLFPQQPVCLVAGNHEFYQRMHGSTLNNLRNEAAGGHVNFLHRDTYEATFNGINLRVLGVTLWTDFDLFGTPDLSMLDAKRGLNDFRLIRHDDGRLLTPVDTAVWHEEDKLWLLSEIEKPFDGMTVIMSHHAPVNFAISSKYVGDRLSPCFASRLENILARDDVALVVWGHTHHSVDRTIGKTRFLSSQTGYVSGLTVETNDFGITITL